MKYYYAELVKQLNHPPLNNFNPSLIRFVNVQICGAQIVKKNVCFVKFITRIDFDN